MNLRQQNIEKRRQRILAAARQVIAAKGPEALSMRTLGAHAGLSVTTLYNLFGTKDDILVALIEDGVATVGPILQDESTSDPFAAVVRLTVSPLAYLIENARIFRPMIAVGLYENRNRAPHMQRLYGRLIASIAQLIEAAQAKQFFIKGVSPRLVAAEIFYSFRQALEDWGAGLIQDDALRRRIQVGAYFVLQAVATDKARASLQHTVTDIQDLALADLGDLFPGLGEVSVQRPAARKGKRGRP